MGVSKKKRLLGQISLHLFLAFTIVQPGLAEVINQQFSGNRNLLSELLKVLEYEPPSRGKPGDTTDAGSRGSCDLLAIVPTHRYGLTVAKYPTFWFYLKSQPSFPRVAKLELQDEQHNIVYKTTFQLTQDEGIIHFRLPQTAPPLAIGKKTNGFFPMAG